MRVETILLSLETQQYAGMAQQALSLESIAEAVRHVEELGFDGATTPEAGHDPFLPLVIAAEHSRRLTLATNVAIAFPRSPMVTAQIAWDLQRLSRGRFQIGLGTQVKGHNERRYAAPWTAPPGPRLRDYVCCLRAMFVSFQDAKNPTFFEGEHYRFTMLPPFFNPGPIEFPPPPIHIAAVNPYMCRLAGEKCDGLRLHPIATFRYTGEVIKAAVEEGARKAGRRRDEIDIIGAPFLAIGRDEKEIAVAREGVRQRIAFYASTRTYHSVLRFHGWEEAGLELHRLSVAGRWKEMPALISDEMLAEWAIVGTPEDVPLQLRQRGGNVFSTVLLDLPPWLRGDRDRIKGMIAGVRTG